jgi:diphosphomevalonate decarboxylase
MKTTAIAHANTALVKYWGKKNEKIILPMNSSISLTTSALTTTTTVEFSKEYSKDSFILNEIEEKGRVEERVFQHLDYIRSLAKINDKAKVASNNNFPMETGLASSASGFAALTLAACRAAGLNLGKKQLSMITRRASGSSSRSIHGGYVEWKASDKSEESFAEQIAPKEWFDIRDIIIVLDTPKRKISTREAMRLSKNTSPLYQTRLEIVERNLLKIKDAILEKDFTLLGKTTEYDCLLMHAIALTSKPPQLFWQPSTIEIMHCVQQMRDDELEVYYTIDTGANMHLLTLPHYEKEVISIVKATGKVKQIIRSRPGEGAKIINNHLF